jgi:hypothetical protein
MSTGGSLFPSAEVLAPRLKEKQAQFVLAKIDQILAWEHPVYKPKPFPNSAIHNIAGGWSRRPSSSR